jgi:acetylornithine/succinyldiaminopimelate/putrescine aminotransferase
VQAQLDRYWHTLVYGEFVLSPQVRLAEFLAAQLPGLDAVYLVNSGTEATEGAMKLAKRFTGRPEIAACRYAYHGSTQGAASLMWPTDFTLPYHPMLPGIRHIDFNCDGCLQQITERTAAVVVETVQAEWGIRKPRAEWLQALRRRCTETGALLILDEIQAGCGRTGTLFAFEQYDVQPDILLLAKGFGGGMPIGAFVAPQRIMQVLSVDPPLGHITTFGGHPVCAAAALATLQTITEPGLLEAIPAKERLFRALLTHPAVKDIRSAGLWLAVDLDDAGKVQRAIRRCLDLGVVTDWFLFNDRSLRVAPALTIGSADIKKAVGIIHRAIEAVGG